MRVILAAILVAVSSLSIAQTPSQAAALFETLSATGLELGQAIMNVGQMASALPSPENESMDRIVEFSASADSKFIHLADLVFLYANMSSAQDRALTQKSMQRTAKHAVAHADASLRAINRSLLGLRSPAAVAEAQRVRDQLQRLRDAVSSTTKN